MMEFANGGINEEKQFFGWRLSSARMVIECALGHLKGRFGCLRRDMDINIKDLPHVIHACFILHNFCEMRKETVNQQNVQAVLKYDKEFQPVIGSRSFVINNNEIDQHSLNILLKNFFV